MVINEVNDGLQNEDVVFEIDSEVKKEFLEKQLKSTRSFYAYVLKRADEFEAQLDKKIYDFNIEDRDEMLTVQFKNKNKWTFQSALSPLKTYVDFCISKSLVRHNENRFMTILPSDYDDYVSDQAKNSSYIPLSESREFQKRLANDQDKLIIELSSLGVRGRTEKGNTLEEFVNLKVKDIKWNTKELHLIKNNGEQRYINVDDYTLDLLKRVINQTFYVSNNGLKTKKNDLGEFEKTNRGRAISPTEYVFRVPGKNRKGKVAYQFFTSRIQRMQKWLEAPYLNSSNLYFSAILDYAKNMLEEKKAKGEKAELTREEYIRINERFEFGENGEKYVFKTRDLVKMHFGNGE